MIAPSGEQITITAGDQQAVVVEVGGGLRSYSASGRKLVDGYGADEMSSSSRGQVLIPWPNRLQDGSYEFDGRRHQLPLNEPERRNAIHGTIFNIRGGSARRGSTMRSPTLSAIRMASLVWSSEIRTAECRSRSGLTRATHT